MNTLLNNVPIRPLTFVKIFGPLNYFRFDRIVTQGCHLTMMPRVLVLQMDYHKCLPTPKVSSQDSFYLRKLRTNLFGVYSANEDIMNCFFYDESIGGSGPNEVISLLNYVLETLIERYGTFHHLILWADNSPAQFKHCFLFFYLDTLVQNGRFLRVDLKFLLEGHSFSICDRRFGCIQQFFNTQEKIETPQEWAISLRNSHLRNVRSHWVSLHQIMNYKSYLKNKYIARSEDINGEKFGVGKIAFMNFGYGEIPDQEGNLTLTRHNETAFIRFTMDTVEKPTIVSFVKKKQCEELNPADLVPVRQDCRPVRENVRPNCITLAQKYLSERALRFFTALAAADQDSHDAD